MTETCCLFYQFKQQQPRAGKGNFGGDAFKVTVVTENQARFNLEKLQAS
jgi:hypothetical protein